MSIEVFQNVMAAILSAAIMATFYSIRSAAKLKAKFAMYAVRDDLVLLVADGKLSQDSPVFDHFYSRANRILADKRPMGLHDLLAAIINVSEKNHDLRRALAQSMATTKSILARPEAQQTDVRKVIDDYYRAVRKIVLTNSNYVRFSYLVSKQISAIALRRTLSAFIPRDVKAGLDVVTIYKRELSRI